MFDCYWINIVPVKCVLIISSISTSHDTEHFRIECFSMENEIQKKKNNSLSIFLMNMSLLKMLFCVVLFFLQFKYYYYFLFIAKTERGELKLSCLQQEKWLQEGNIFRRERKKFPHRIRLDVCFFFILLVHTRSNTYTTFSPSQRKARTNFLTQ